MSLDLVLGQTPRSFSLGALPEGARDYAPNKWLSPSEAESMVAALMLPRGFFSPALSREQAERRVGALLRAKKVGITSEPAKMGLDLAVLLINRLRGKPDDAPLLDPGVPPLTPVVSMTKAQKTAEGRGLALLEPSTRELARSILAWSRARGLRVDLGETHRSLADQMALPEGRTGIERGKIGWHQVGRAFHLVIRDERGKIVREAYKTVGDEVERRGGVWLGRQPLWTPKGPVDDYAHFEYHPGLVLSRYRNTAQAAKELASMSKRAARYA
jgi:hypothetical protein